MLKANFTDNRINLTDDKNIINKDNMANKNIKKIINYTKKDNLNIEYMRKFNNRNISNRNELKSNNLKYEKRRNINNNISNFNLYNNNITAYNSIKLGDSLNKCKNKLDNGNSGSQIEFKMSNNNIVKP
jgi:hypothetical protein